MQVSKVEDVDRINELKNLVESHCATLNINYDSSEIKTSLMALIAHPESCVFALEDDDTLKGYIIGTLSRNLVDGSVMCIELGFYNEAKGHGQLLIDALEEWAQNTEASSVCMTSHNDTEGRLDSYYQRKGYQLKEKIYEKRIV